ncbi:MAG: cytochrome o ubiquinol oxidase subunit III [Gammaproteobacteria bacterium]|nr:cytochrome o ubiquinol oxidase subunit III [Gammaproteobacteria bacterium]
MHSEISTTHEHHIESNATDVFGFWLYILTDCILFGSLFATFIVLNFPEAPGPTLKSFIDLPYVLIETFVLLASNFTFCLAMLNLYQANIMKVRIWLAITFLLGATFIAMEVTEFFHLAHEGFRWDVNGRASSFFTLVGTHGFHVTCGLLWILLMIIQMPLLKDASVAQRRMTYLGLFWNFLDIVWIFVFTIVYLMGAI